MKKELRSSIAAAMLAMCASCGTAAPPTASPGAAPSRSAACPPFRAAPAASADRPVMLLQQGHAQAVARMALSDDGRILVSMSHDGTLLVWDTTTGLLLRRILTQGMPFHLALSGAGDKLAYGVSVADERSDAQTFLVDLERGAPPREAADFGAIALSPDGKLLVVGGSTVEVYDAETLASLRSIDPHFASGRALALGFDRSGKRLGIAAVGEVAVVDVASGAILQRRPRSNALTSAPTKLDFTGDTLLVRVGPATTELFAVAPGATASPSVLTGPFRDSSAGGGRAWTLREAEPMGQKPAVRFAQRLTAYDPSGVAKLEDELPSYATALAVSADGAIIALARDDGRSLRTITIRDGSTLRPLRTIDVFASGIDAVTVDPRSDALLTRSRLGTITRWDLARGTMLPSTPGDEDALPNARLAVDAQGSLLVASGFDTLVRVRAAKGGPQLRQWEPHRDHPVVAASFVPAGRELITVSNEGSIARWDLGPEAAPPPRSISSYTEWNRPAGREVATLAKPTWKAALSLDGRWLAYDGDKGTLGVLDASTGARRWEVASPSQGAELGRNRWIAFSADGSRLLLSAKEGTWGVAKSVLRVFDATSGALVTTLRPGTAGPMAVRAGFVALGGLRPSLLDPTTFARRAHIGAFDSEVTSITIHPSRDLLILGGNGGGTAIASAATGAPMALFLAAGGGDFISSTPEGAFVASVDGARSLAWTFTSPLEGYAFNQFAAVYEQPEAVRGRLAGEPPRLVSPLSRPPRLSLSGAPQAQVAARSVALHADVSSQGRVDQLRVFVNGRAAIERAVCAPRAALDLEIPLLPGQNRVSLVGYDASGFAGNPKQLDMVSTDVDAPKPELWVVSVGVSRYPKLAPAQQLDFATSDARAITASLAGQAGPGKPFAELHAVTLLDEEVSVEGVERAIEGLAAMGPDDLAVVFFAGHGVQLAAEAAGAAKRMVFLTSGAALSLASARENGVGWDRIEGALAKARGRVLMLLDACHSGHVSTELIAPNEALAQKLATGGRAGVLVFAASRGSQLSYEVPSSNKRMGSSRGLELAWEGSSPPFSASPGGGGHGLFTGAMLEALAGGATDRDHSGAVEVGEFIDFVTERVRAASNGKQTPWVARREMFGDFVIAPAGGGGPSDGRTR